MTNFSFTTEDGTVILLTTTYKCLVCGQENENYLDIRPHIDSNVGHYFVEICR